ncbi:tripartite motif-containing protein 2-like [Saccoglossus kowalevskii]|uniref:Tripartite motif-containing protein 3-like n=1 Tax=Saccoglossus kowalevskii TaxID=10224 RepID=A0ABM0H0S4_SACKO|nr:PREDICTED: tripartite motif-containing protein 3-like [Saccoglossus kowalevskii]
MSDAGDTPGGDAEQEETKSHHSTAPSTHSKVPSQHSNQLNGSMNGEQNGEPPKTPEDKTNITDLIDDMFLTCAICNNRFNQPKVLSCLHSFCTGCLESYESSNGGELECPVCGKDERRSIRDLPHNTLAMGLIDLKTILGSNEATKCNVCDKDAAVRCYDCADFLCEDCEKVHKKMKLGKGHRMTSLQEFIDSISDMQNSLLKRSSLMHPTVCSDHEGFLMEQYCETCDIPVCDKCTTTEHKYPQHHVTPLQESVSRQFNHLERLLRETEKKIPPLQQSLTDVRAVLMDIETQCDFAEIKLRDRVRREIEQLRKLENDLVDEMEHKILGKRAVLDEQFQRLQQGLNNIHDSCDFTENMLKFGNPLDMIGLNSELENRLQELMATRIKLEPVDSSAIEFTSNEDFHTSLHSMNHLGTISVARKPTTPARSPSSTAEYSPRVTLNGDDTPHYAPSTIPEETELEVYRAESPLPPPITLSIPQVKLPPTPPPPRGTPQNVPMTRDAVTMTTDTRDIGSMTNDDSPPRYTPVGLRFSRDGRPSRGPSRKGRAGDEDISARVYTPAHQVHRAKVATNPDGSYSVGYNPTMPGNHDLRINFLGQPYGEPLALSMQPEHYQQFARGAQGQNPPGINIILKPAKKNQYYADELENESEDDDDEWLEGRPFLKIGGKGTAPGKLCGPRGIAISHNDDIVVADRGNNRMQVFFRDGKLSHVFSYRNFTRKFDPVGVAITNSEQLLISDYDNKHVLLCDYDGRIIRTIGSGILKGPWGVAVGRHGLVHVVDHPQHCVRTFSLDGTHVHTFGGKGEGPGEFNYPLYVAVNNRDNIIVSDYCYHRVQVFDYRGTFLFDFGTHGDRQGQFYRPTGVACTQKDDIIVNDYLSNKVQLFKPNGSFVRHLNNDSKWLECPEGIAIASEKPLRVAVVDSGHHCIKVF